MSCSTCQPIPDCVEGLEQYSLQDQDFLFTSECPPGFFCGGGDTVFLICCDQTVTQLNYPTGSTQSEREALLQALVDNCVRKKAFCDPDTGGTTTTTTTNTTVLFYSRSKCCTVKCADGNPFVYCVRAGLFIAFTQLQADFYANRYACQQAIQHKICMGNLTPTCCANSAFTATITATGKFLAQNPASNQWELIDGALPTGLTFNGGLLPAGTFPTITGTPTVGGIFTFTVKVVAPNGDWMMKSYDLCVISQTVDPAGSDDSHFPNATPNTPYTATLSSSVCAVAPLSWQVKPGDSLPPGLTLDETTGVVSGTPTVAGTYVFTIILQTEAS